MSYNRPTVLRFPEVYNRTVIGSDSPDRSSLNISTSKSGSMLPVTEDPRVIGVAPSVVLAWSSGGTSSACSV